MSEAMTCEAAVARLEAIVKAMEEGTLPLDDSLKVFEEGIGLVRFCNAKLDAAEQKVRILLTGEDGKLTESDFVPPTKG